jgi:hypothetical protein
MVSQFMVHGWRELPDANLWARKTIGIGPIRLIGPVLMLPP